MAYSNTTWINGNEPYLNATNMNNIEAGIYNNDNRITQNTQDIATKIQANSYATSTTGGTIKIRVTGTDCYITTDGTNP